MKRFSQTLKVALALFVAVFANGLLPSVAAAAVPAEEQPVSNVSEVTTPKEVTPTEPQPNQEETTSTPEPSSLLTMPEVQSEGQIAAFGASQSYQRDVLVVPLQPTVSDICGTGGDTYTIPVVVGVDYYRYVSGPSPDVLLVQGQTYSTNDNSSVTIIAKTKNGYTFANDKHEVSWRLDFSSKCTICHRTASTGNPYTKIEVDDSAINGRGNGDHYLEHTGPVFPATGTDGKWGDIIPPLPGEHNGLNWTSEGQAIYNNNCAVPLALEVTPGPCAYFDTTSQVTIDFSGTIKKDTSLVIRDSQNTVIKRWDIAIDHNGNVTFPSLPVTYNGLAAGSYTVEIASNQGDTLVSTLVSKAFVIEQCYYTVSPEEPKKLDLCYGDKDKLYIKNTRGVTYTVNNVTMSGWVQYTGTALVVNAEPADGYMFEDEATTSWTFDETDFTNEDCLTITKSGKVASDTNHNGVIDAGDEISWEITVTNTSESKCENFYVTVDDANVTLENDGYVGSLGAGESVTLAATSTITAADLQACKAINVATFSGWRSFARGENSQLRGVFNDEMGDPLATGSATAVYTLTCPTPGSGSSSEVTTAASTTAEPTVLPATGPESSANPLLIIVAALMAYGTTYFIQRRRETSTN